MDFKKSKIGIFAKGMVYDFGKKVEVFPSFVFIKNWSRNLVPDVLDRNEAFKRYKNICW